MWIIPSTLLKCAPGMVALDLASKESLVRDCEPSHIVSLRGSLKPISSVRWKKDSWMSHLFGAMLNPSHTENFTDWWTSSLQDTHANHSVTQVEEEGKTTQDTCGLGLQMEFGFSDQECASLRMSKDTSALDSAKSSENWKKLVTKCRGEYSLRVKLAHPTSASGCSSWPTCAARDYKGESGLGRQERKGNPADTLPNAVAQHHGPHAPANWPTPNCMDVITPKRDLANMESKGHWGKKPRNRPDGIGFQAPNTGKLSEMVKYGHPAPVNPSTHGNRQESWATPSTMLGSMYVEHNAHKRNSPSLATQAAWSTPRANKVHPEITEENRQQLATRNKSNLEEEIAGHCGTATGKLNPRWVETLMGLPIGWTMPSCACPVIPAPMSYAFSEMVLCQAQQNEHLES